MSDIDHDDLAAREHEGSDVLRAGHFHDSPEHVVRHRPAFVEQFVGVVRGGSCSMGGGNDYSDARYFISRSVPQHGMVANNLLETENETLPGVAGCLTATNIAELANGTHLLAAGAVVQVFALRTRATPGAKVFVFNQPPVAAVVVKITGPAGGAGEYNGRVLGGAASAAPGAALGMPAGMTSPGGDNALVLNVEEDGITGHRLKSGSYAVGVVRGSTAETPPRSIVFIRGGVGRVDSPTVIGGASEGSESADASSWSRDTNGTPVDIYMVSRTVYNEAGDRTLYQFVRKLSFDARGLLVGVGGESRVTIDVTEACP
ncbi:MAG: hypothetical protein JWN24_47 [Phycisphaerales bacterium]|nr:hypothetical protein [Phycisphaerales bacterium]